MVSEEKLRIAWFSPLVEEGAASSATVSAYVTTELLPYLVSDFEIDLFHLSTGDGTAGKYHFLEAIERYCEEPYDLFFYQVEDHPASVFTRIHLALFPGVVLFHDVLFRNAQRDIEILRFTDHVNRSLGLLKDLGKMEGEHFAGRECGSALVPLFSTERNLAEYRRLRCRSLLNYGNLPLEPSYLPYPVDPKISSPNVEKLFGDELPTIVFPGSVHIEHRAHHLLAAISKLSVDCRLVWLLDREEEQAARRLCTEFGVEGVRFEFPRTVSAWKQLVCSADAAVHLLFSAYGDPGPWLAISLMAGLPCVVNDFSAAAWFPDSVLFKIRCGDGESDELLRILTSILTRAADDELSAKEQLSVQYAVEQFSTPMVANELKYLLSTCGEQVREFTRSWWKQHAEALFPLIEESRTLDLAK